MRSFSVARAFSAGVDLIERKPWTLLWWALAVAVLQLAPQYLLSAASGADELGATRDVFASLFSHDAARMQAANQHLSEAQAGRQVWAFPLLFWGFLSSAILYNAAYRSVLEPQNSSFGYLRLGMAELWQFLVLIVQWLLILVYVAACLIVLFVVALVAKAAGPQASGWILGVMIAVMVVLTYWLMLRLSLGTVATFARRRFAYFDSWSLTKGRVWRLFWTGFLLFALVIGLYVMFFFSVAFSMVPLAAILRGVSGAPAAAHGPVTAAELLSPASAGIMVLLLASSLIVAVFQALTFTPWAVAYQSLTAADDAGR
jgi:hypothetical protein